MKYILLLICLAVLVSNSDCLILDKLFNILPSGIQTLIKKIVYWACPHEKLMEIRLRGEGEASGTSKTVKKTVSESRK
uniref:Uncharacterized protein n=1 Tax=Trichobilharzia regenti TaxID=157069 RepID=A0AA85KGZ0_TRIRE|nr:unnamed protein product [Trichobilharzia regenti]